VTNKSVLAGIGRSVVGRSSEIELVVAALAAGRHLVLEGPPGTGKTTMLRAVAGQLGIGFEFVEGNAELTPGRLVGHFDPARVLVDGYDPDVFVDGPLAAALRAGSLLYIEELNRVPEETLNVLVTVMSERELTVPRLGRIEAEPGFRLVAAMNPFDAVGTARISAAIYDRVCRLGFNYQDANDEEEITRRGGGFADPDFVGRAVELVRRTRTHPDVRIGSSVRGSIDMCAIAESLGDIRNLDPTNKAVSLDAALLALTGRIRIREGVDRNPEAVITELWAAVFEPQTPNDDEEPNAEDQDPGKASAPTGATPQR